MDPFYASHPEFKPRGPMRIFCRNCKSFMGAHDCDNCDFCGTTGDQYLAAEVKREEMQDNGYEDREGNRLDAEGNILT